jgi:streptogramin lyase
MQACSRLAACFAALLSLQLAGCGGGGPGPTAPASVEQPAAQQVKILGVVRAGSLAVRGASLTVYASAASGQMPQFLGKASSDSTGAFELNLTCSTGAANSEQIYLSLSGGETQATNDTPASNPAIRLMAILGPCNDAPKAITVNELTTVAAAYALNAFVNGDAISGNAPGLPNAIATAASLVDPGSGALAASLPSAASCTSAGPTDNCEAVEKLNMLADALGACVSSASANSAACTALFSCAAPGATDNGSGPCIPPSGVTAPTDTWQAITTIARNPGLVSITGVYRASIACTEYATVAAAAPNDWALSLTYSGGGLSEPTALAIDAVGDVWLANYNNAVSEFSPTGVAMSPAGGYVGGGLEESFGITIDAAGHVWVCNEQSPATFNSALGSITELASDGTVLSGANGFAGGGLNFPEALTADAAGNIWITNYGNSTLTEFASDGTALSPGFGFTGGGLSFPVGIAADAKGNLWVADQGANRISAFTASGAAFSPAAGFMGGGLTVPQGIVVDQGGHVWVTNYYGDSVTEFSDQGASLSSTRREPGGIAVDGAGQVWVANYGGGSISELSGAQSDSPGSARSPASGFTANALLQPFAVAIDPSGNLWVSNFGNDTVAKFIGIAVPVATPMIGVPHSP